MARESGNRRREPNRSLAIRLACAVAVLASVVSISAPEAHGPAVSGPVPRFTDDADRSLLVFEERAGTPRQEALRVVLESDPVSGRRRIRVGGLPALAATLAIECDARTWNLPLAHATGSGPGAVSIYAVTDPVAASCMASSTCRLLGLEDEVTVPVDRLRVAWRPLDPRRSSELFAEPVHVLDSSTITVRIDGRLEAVRYIGVAAPTLHPPKGSEAAARDATRANQDLLRGQVLRVELDARDRDDQGALLAYVYSGDRMVNAELIRRGLARTATVPPNLRHADRFLALEREAREDRRGLWKTAASDAPGRLGVKPTDQSSCPASHPVKGRLLVESSMRCVVAAPGGEAYVSTRPDRCYANAAEARRDGCLP